MRQVILGMMTGILALSLPGLAQKTTESPCVIKGTVKTKEQSQPLEKVTIRIKNEAVFGEASQSNGQFDVDVTKYVQKKHNLPVVFEKKGFKPTQRVIDVTAGKSPCATTILVEMVAEEPKNPSLEPSKEGRTIFVAPFFLIKNQDETSDSEFDDLFYMALDSKIKAFIARLRNISSPPAEISISRIKEKIRGAEAERVRTIGNQLNALGIITGMRQIGKTNEGKNIFRLRSTFLVIPTHPRYKEFPQQIDDQLESEIGFSPMDAPDKMSKQWGERALIALAVKELSDIKPEDGSQKLKHIHDYLSAVSKDMGKDETLYREIQTLLEFIEERQGREKRQGQ